MRRRDVVRLIGGAALMPLRVRAQGAMPVVGVLSSASSQDYAPMIAAMKKGLASEGFVENRNVRIELSGLTSIMNACRLWRRSSCVGRSV